MAGLAGIKAHLKSYHLCYGAIWDTVYPPDPIPGVDTKLAALQAGHGGLAEHRDVTRKYIGPLEHPVSRDVGDYQQDKPKDRVAVAVGKSSTRPVANGIHTVHLRGGKTSSLGRLPVAELRDMCPGVDDFLKRPTIDQFHTASTEEEKIELFNPLYIDEWSSWIRRPRPL
ncbi:hypothetical protein FQN51_008100 [Onygenales sp. PD_10]|nr:hypothetical protein FQN51_008100 [Onygenales sp. PD_10]